MKPDTDERTSRRDEEAAEKVNRQFSYRNILMVMLFSLLLSGYLIYVSFDFDSFRLIQWTANSLLILLLGYLLLGVRHLAYMYRIRHLTGKVLTWRQSFEVITLWLFSSAVTPSTVGGAAVAVYLLKKENLTMGKSVTTSMLTVFLDQAFFAFLAPVFTLMVGRHAMFAKDVGCRSQSDLPLMQVFHDVEVIYYFAYGFYMLIVLGLMYGLFINAGAFKTFLSRLFSLRFLRRWKEDAMLTGDDIIETSHELKGKGVRFWVKAVVSTSVAWFSMFLISFCILAAFFDAGALSWLEVMARQAVIWMITLIPATPGGAGVAEISFSALMCDITSPALVPIVALLWRMVSFYPYLLTGIIFIPRWMGRVYRS
jgi:uncharacterized membrane protein YbhN (UPF0104 family)